MTFAAPHPLKIAAEPIRQALVRTFDFRDFIFLGLLFAADGFGLRRHRVERLACGLGDLDITLLTCDAVALYAHRHARHDKAQDGDKGDD